MIDADSMHRLAKLMIDNGETSSMSETLLAFGRYGTRIRLGCNTARDLGSQIIALTAINCAARSFNGNVLVEGDDFELTAPGFEGMLLADFLQWAGVNPLLPPSASWPCIVIGDASVEPGDVPVWSASWHFGLGSPRRSGPVFAPSCVAAAGLAINEAFSILRHDNAYAGRRSMALSLWNPGSPNTAAPDDVDAVLSGGLWMLGLGHLGQAYAWTLGFMPANAQLVYLQDIDVITRSSISTSMICQASECGERKTRVAARWLERRGYQTVLVERRFDGFQRVRSEEPAVALFGVDNAAARRVAEGAGFRRVIDAGLGSGPRDFRGIRIRSFPGLASAAALWSSEIVSSRPLAPAYRQMVEEGADECGVAQLATRAVGAPFVGCVAAGYALSELIRRSVGGPCFDFIDTHLKDPAQLEVG